MNATIKLHCVAIIADRDVRDSVVRYFCWFNAKTKYEQDSIVFEWFKYSSYLKKGFKITWFHLPFIDDGMTVVPEAVRIHVLCSRGLLLVLNWGSRRWRSIRKASTVMGVMTMHKAKGKTKFCAGDDYQRWIESVQGREDVYEIPSEHSSPVSVG